MCAQKRACAEKRDGQTRTQNKRKTTIIIIIHRYDKKGAITDKMDIRAVLSLSALLTVLLAARVQSAGGSSRATTLATFNTGFFRGTIGNVDARVEVLIDQVRNSLHT